MLRNYCTFPVLIICGGLGTRVSKIYKNTPKSLIEIKGKPFLFWQLDSLIKQGVKKVILCTGYLSNQIEKAVRDYPSQDLDIIISNDGDSLLGTGGAIKKASVLAEDIFFVMYGDSFLTTSFLTLENYFLKHQPFAMLTVFKNNNKYDNSNIVYKDNKILEYKKNSTKKMSYIDYGLGIYRSSTFENFSDLSFDLSIVIKKLVDESKLFGYEVDKRFYEIGSVKGIKDLEKIL